MRDIDLVLLDDNTLTLIVQSYSREINYLRDKFPNETFYINLLENDVSKINEELAKRELNYIGK